VTPEKLTLSVLSFFCSFLSGTSTELDVFALEAAGVEIDFLECDALLFLDDLAWSSSPDVLE